MSSAAQLRALRKRYGLGEFAPGARKRRRRRRRMSPTDRADYNLDRAEGRQRIRSSPRRRPARKRAVSARSSISPWTL